MLNCNLLFLARTSAQRTREWMSDSERGKWEAGRQRFWSGEGTRVAGKGEIIETSNCPAWGNAEGGCWRKRWHTGQALWRKGFVFVFRSLLYDVSLCM